jgi:hypothetical protein
MKTSLRLTPLLLFALGLPTLAQKPPMPKATNIEFSGGYLHVTGNQGLDGFDVGAAAWFSRSVSVAFDYDGVFDTSNLGLFQITPTTGQIIRRSHLQDFLIGPRIFVPSLLKSNQKVLRHMEPYLEAQFGTSHLSTSVNSVTENISQSNSDTGFSWMLGGGLDYWLSPHWTWRTKVDFLRTHFANEGQSRLRFGFELAYFIRNKEKTR